MSPRQEVTFESACASLELLLNGPARREIVADAAKAPDLGQALLRLRRGMQSNVWKTATERISLDRFVRQYDRRTRQECFHALHDWDGKADRVNENTIPVDVLDYLVVNCGGDPPERVTLAILLDYYFMYLLALLALRVWDGQQPDADLDRVNHL